MCDAAVDVKGPEGAAVELHSPFHFCVEGLDHGLQFWWAANFWKNLEETVSDDNIKRIFEVSESDIQEHLIFRGSCCSLHFCWVWRKEKTMFIVDLPTRKTHCNSGQTRSASFCSRIKMTFARTLPMMLRSEMPL